MENEEFICKLIKTVHKYRCLYDKFDKNYFNKVARAEAWENVAQIVGKSEEDCKHRWKLLRERYSKEVKKEESPSGSGQYFHERWKYFDQMKFLRDSLTLRSTRDNSEYEPLTSASENIDVNTTLVEPDNLLSATPSKKSKTDVGSIYERIGGAITSIEKALQEPETTTHDHCFWLMVSKMTSDLKENIKDDLKESVMKLVFEAKRLNYGE